MVSPLQAAEKRQLLLEAAATGACIHPSATGLQFCPKRVLWLLITTRTEHCIVESSHWGHWVVLGSEWSRTVKDRWGALLLSGCHGPPGMGGWMCPGMRGFRPWE